MNMRKVLEIDVGDLPPQNALALVDRIRGEHKSKGRFYVVEHAGLPEDTFVVVGVKGRVYKVED